MSTHSQIIPWKLKMYTEWKKWCVPPDGDLGRQWFAGAGCRCGGCCGGQTDRPARSRRRAVCFSIFPQTSPVQSVQIVNKSKSLDSASWKSLLYNWNCRSHCAEWVFGLIGSFSINRYNFKRFVIVSCIQIIQCITLLISTSGALFHASNIVESSCVGSGCLKSLQASLQKCDMT